MGRPRSFDIHDALNSALNVFWEKGYEGTSMPDLTDAMGINRPSLYAAFGNKESLFVKVLDHYRATAASYFKGAIEKPTAREVFQSLLYGAIKLQASGENPAGCLFVHGALVCSDDSIQVRSELILRRKAAEIAIEERFNKAIEDGDLSADENPSVLARFTCTLLHGFSIQAVNGDSVDDLHCVADIAIRSFPKTQKRKGSRNEGR